MSLYYARDCISNRSHSRTFKSFETVQRLRKNRFLTGLCIVYASCCSNHALTSDLFFLDNVAESLFTVEKADGLAGL